MFNRNKNTNVNEQIPYSLYETLHEGTPRRGRWLLEVLIAGAVVVLLVAGGVWLFRFVHDAKTPTPTQGTNVTQTPQEIKSNDQSTGAPATTPQGNSTNSNGVAQPAN